MAALDGVAREVISDLLPLLDEHVAARVERYVGDGEPVLGLEQAVLVLARHAVLVPAGLLEPLRVAVEARAAAGGDVEFLREPLAHILGR